MRPNDYPRTKFADENDPYKQFKHINEELREFNVAQFDNNVPEMILEVHDIIQSAFTLMDILEREYPGQAWAAREEMIEKNRARGYYPEGGCTDGGKQIPGEENCS